MEIQPWHIILGIVYLLLCVILAIIVLLQQRGKGGMAGVFGGGGGAGAEQIFGSSGVAPFMTKITAILGAVFLTFAMTFVLLTGTGRTTSSGGGGGTQQAMPPIPGLVENEGRGGSEGEATETAGEQESAQPATDVRQLLFDTTGSGGQ